MNNTLSIIMLLCMALCTVYVFIRLYRKKPSNSNVSSVSGYIITGMVVGGILGWFIGLYIVNTITVKSEGDVMWSFLSTLFFIVIMGLCGMVFGVRKNRT
jgi:hypothetical protein